MLKSPIISIITPTYNRAHLLPRMINSVINQSFKDWELIIMDDGSSDDTEEIILKIADDRIKYYYTDNSGAGDKRNQGVTHAIGDNIIFLDSDDEVKSNWLSTLFTAKESNYGDLVCCGLEKYDQDLNFISNHMPRKLEGIFSNIEVSYLAGTLLLNRCLFLYVGGYDISLESGQHSDLMLRLVPEIYKRNLKVISVHESLVLVHNHEGPKIRNNSRAILNGTLKILEKHKELFDLDRDTHYNYLNVAAVAAFRIKDTHLGNKLLVKAFKLYPFRWRSLLRFIRYSIHNTNNG